MNSAPSTPSITRWSQLSVMTIVVTSFTPGPSSPARGARQRRRQRQRRHRPPPPPRDRDRGLRVRGTRTFAGDELLLRAANGQDGGLRGVDDGVELRDAVHAQVGDGEGAPRELRRRQLVRLRLGRERLRAHAPSQPRQPPPPSPSARSGSRAAPRTLTSAERAAMGLVSARRRMGTMRPCSVCTATEMSAWRNWRVASSPQCAFTCGNLVSAAAQALTTKSFTESLTPSPASCSLI
eukprot:scaffold905_cov310-Prasinococcus_capsulatus_cf.AAC.1